MLPPSRSSREREPFRIFRVEDQHVFWYVTTVVASTKQQALHDFLAARDQTGEVFVAQARSDPGPPEAPIDYDRGVRVLEQAEAIDDEREV